MFNIISIIAGLAIGKLLGPYIGLSDIYAMSYGVVVGGLAQLLWQLPSLRRAGFGFKLKMDWSDPGLRRILWLMGPAILGNAAVAINVTVNNNLASRLGDGPVSWLNYAFRFMQLPIGIFGYAIASATLPSISRSAANHDMVMFRQTLSRSLGMVFLLTVPSAVGLVVLGDSIVGAVYQRRAFTSADTEATARALAFYAIGLAGYAAAKVLNPAFYALGDAKTPMAVSMASVAINLALAVTAVQVFGMGHAGIALATSAVAMFGSIALFVIMRKRIAGIYGRNLWRSFVRVTIASVVMGTVVFLTSHAIRDWLGAAKIARVADLAFSIPAGMAALYFTCRALGVPELDMAVTALAGPLKRRLRRTPPAS
jgi:putative peptidoglycan lipid II flippase